MKYLSTLSYILSFLFDINKRVQYGNLLHMKLMDNTFSSHYCLPLNNQQ